MNDLFESFLRGHRFEAIVLLAVVMAMAAGSASALAYVVNWLFEPLQHMLEPILR